MDELTIEKLERGYVVEIGRCGGVTGDFDLERLACADRLDVVAEVLDWLGWDDEEAADAVDVLDDTEYVLTDKGRAALDAPRPDERGRYDDAARRAAAIRRTVEEQAGGTATLAGRAWLDSQSRREATEATW